ncbi:MAG: BTAD domain-containing putative transcriptional regulator [Burkholderiaceae bacterium]
MRLLLLGRPRIELDGASVAGHLPLKHQALLYFLALEGGAVSRGQLATLFWGELDDGAARANLRGALTRLKRSLPDVLEADNQQVSLGSSVPLWVDRCELARALEREDDHGLRTLAAQSWRGPLLEGFELAGAEVFGHWIGQARARAQRDALALRQALARQAEDAGQDDEAIAHWRGVLDIDDADEPAHMALMRLLAADGQRTAAIAQYEACRAALAESLGARPSAGCYELYTRIHADAPAQRRPQSDVLPAEPVVPDGADVVDALPAVEGELVGRDSDLALLVERVSDPQCHWLTVVGPGGAGKTRLTLALVEAVGQAFRHGVLWLSGSDAGGTLRDAETLAQRVTGRTGADRFEPRALLLVLDNLETVRDAAALVPVLLSRAPGVRVVATSRRRLGASREWLLEIGGLSTVACRPGEPTSSPAARLLCQAVHRFDPRFDPASCAEAIERLCERVGGLPLALELAARSIHDTGIDGVLARLDAGLTLEGAPPGTEAERQRSIDLVMEDSWILLADEDRLAAMRLAWLPGAFDLALAQAVGVSIPRVETLREHCWLRRNDDATLALHPLQQVFLRQRPEGRSLRGRVSRALALATLDALPPVDVPGDPRPGSGVCAAAGVLDSAGAPLFSAAVLSEALGHWLEQVLPDTLGDWMDRVMAWLWSADRLHEVASMLERASRSRHVPPWRLAAWDMQRGEALNTLGQVLESMSAFEQGMERMGMARATVEGSRWVDLLPALRAGFQRTGWPPAGPQRVGFVRLLSRSQALYTQQLSFTADMDRSVRSNMLASLVAYRVGGPAQRQAVRVMSAYGVCTTGHPWLARHVIASLGRRTPVLDDQVQELFTREGVCATRIALGQWDGVGEELASLCDALEQAGDHRHAMECHSLQAKLLYYQGQLDRASHRFADNTELSLRRPGGAWRAWGPFGLAEVTLCQHEIPLDAVRHWVELGSYWLSEMISTDAAYVLRRIGLVARLAWLDGDLARARDAALGGTAAAARIRHCGFWAHEGYAGIGDVLLQLHAQDTGLGARAIEDAWARFQKPLLAHGRRFPAGVAMIQRLQGEWALSHGRERLGQQLLVKAVHSAERQGLRVELARACQALARLDSDEQWRERAQRLWVDMRVPARSTA